jgi:hypothetical protein
MNCQGRSINVSSPSLGLSASPRREKFVRDSQLATNRKVGVPFLDPQTKKNRKLDRWRWCSLRYESVKTARSECCRLTKCANSHANRFPSSLPS